MTDEARSAEVSLSSIVRSRFVAEQSWMLMLRRADGPTGLMVCEAELKVALSGWLSCRKGKPEELCSKNKPSSFPVFRKWPQGFFLLIMPFLTTEVRQEFGGSLCQRLLTSSAKGEELLLRPVFLSATGVTLQWNDWSGNQTGTVLFCFFLLGWKSDTWVNIFHFYTVDIYREQPVVLNLRRVYSGC